MKKIFISIIILLGLIILPKISLAQNSVDVWMFGTATCPYCQDLKAYISGLAKDNPQIDYTYFELTGIINQDNRDKLDSLKKIYKATDYTGVPITFIGDRVIRGDRKDEVDLAIEYCQATECESPAEKLALAGGINEPNNVTDAPAGQKEQVVGWVILAMFILVVVIFGIKIIKERK